MRWRERASIVAAREGEVRRERKGGQTHRWIQLCQFPSEDSLLHLITLVTACYSSLLSFFHTVIGHTHSFQFIATVLGRTTRTRLTNSPSSRPQR